MTNDIMKVQADCLELSRGIRSLLKSIQSVEQKGKNTITDDKLEPIISYGRVLPKIVGLFGYENYYEKANQIGALCEKIMSEEGTESDIAALCGMIDDMAGMTERLVQKRRSICCCCGKQVYYRPLPSYYGIETEKHGGEVHIGETINKEDYSCPVCGASDRDRLITAFLRRLGLDTEYCCEALLQIAPSRAIEHWIYANCPALTYHSTDLYMKGVTFTSDVANMVQIKDESYDYIICSHVLEHVQDDRKAMREIRRVMKKDGFCLFLVPIWLDKEHIDEAWGLSEDENWRRFGQGDHCRAYARQELIERLEEAGFYVHALGKEYFGDEVFGECCLTDTSVLYVLTKQEGDIEKLVKEKRERRIEPATEQPLVSVIMSAYNHEKYVAEAIESVLNQTYSNIEFLVADDCSTDGTVQEILKYEDRIDQIHLFGDNAFGRKPFLSSIAKGKYIAVMNSDDVWCEDKLSMQVAYMENHPECGACFTGVATVAEDEEGAMLQEFIADNKKKEEWMHHFFINGNCLAHPSVLIDRLLYEKLLSEGAYAFRQLGDFWMWTKLIQNYEIHVIERELTKFRYHETGKNQNVCAHTMENNRRLGVEEAYIWYHTIKNMDARFFVEAFKEELLNKDAKEESEILCEKFFVLLNADRSHLMQAAAFFVFDIYQKPDVAETLEKKYRFSRKDVYALTGAVEVQSNYRDVR